jgi:predicted nucleic acid-binding protein
VTYLLDTNVVSELRKRPGVVDPHVLAWAEARPAHQLSISAITVMEIELGILLLERRDADQGKMLRQWFERGVLVGFAGRILPVDVGVARRAAQLHAPDPRPERDEYIAATALEHGLTVATRNIADFEPTGVPLVDPWAY